MAMTNQTATMDFRYTHISLESSWSFFPVPLHFYSSRHAWRGWLLLCSGSDWMSLFESSTNCLEVGLLAWFQSSKCPFGLWWILKSISEQVLWDFRWSLQQEGAVIEVLGAWICDINWIFWIYCCRWPLANQEGSSAATCDWPTR
jgi:hypothetical protein